MRHLSPGACVLVLVASAALSRAAPPAEKFELRDGDRVAFLGNTFFEREQAHSYLETLLASRYPDRNVIFRNIAWSGDTVFGHARAAFDTPEQGFERLIKVAHDVKPTVLFISYGMGESFDGERGLSAFRQGLDRMLDRLGDLKARTVLVSPIRHEDLGEPYPNPSQHNQDLRRYIDVLKETADRRGFWFVDLYELLGDGAQSTPRPPLTDNGIHLTPYGYWRAALAVEQGLGMPPRGWTMTLDAAGGNATGKGVEPTDVRKDGAAPVFKTAKELLPPPPLPAGSPEVRLPEAYRRVLTVTGLPQGHWSLGIDGKLAATGSAEEWAKGVEVAGGPLAEQAEKLRRVAVLKNMQFFNQWRPQNETYLFGFRRNEQGQNAKEIPQFEQPIAEKEAEMAKLRAAGPRTYRLEREDQ